MSEFDSDFESEEMTEMLLHIAFPNEDLDSTTNCSKCKKEVLIRETAPLSYEEPNGETITLKICEKCLSEYIKQEKELKRNHIKWFLGGGRE